MTHPRWYGPMGAVLVLVGAIGFFAGIDALRKDTPNVAAGVLGIGSLVVAVLVMVIVSKLVRRTLRLDREGIEIRTRSGEVSHIRWNEPHDFYYQGIAPAGLARLAMPKVQKVSVRTPDGRRVDIEDVKVRGNPNAGLPAFVEQQSTAARWPGLWAQLQGGASVRFGKVELSREQVKIGRDVIRLDAPIELGVTNGIIEIKRGGSWRKSAVRVRQVANYPCLLRALGELARR